MDYWTQRILNQTDRIYNKTTKEAEVELRKLYRESLKANEQQMIDVWNSIKDSENGEIKPNDLYRYNRYFSISKALQESLRQLGDKEVSVYQRAFESAYKSQYDFITKMLKEKGLIPNTGMMDYERQVQEVLNSVWCADGKNWSSRIWTNKALLVNKLEQGLIECIARGVSKDTLVTQIKSDFNTGFFNADRIVRTELTYVQNQACMNRYKDAGIKEFQFLAEIDSRTSQICQELNGKVFKMKDAVVGENVPPIHPFAVALLYQLSKYKRSIETFNSAWNKCAKTIK